MPFRSAMTLARPQTAAVTSKMAMGRAIVFFFVAALASGLNFSALVTES